MENRDSRMGRLVRHSAVMLLVLLALLASGSAFAQELEPRAYSPSPVGANFLLAAYSYQSGEILFDPSLPFSDVEAKINGVVGGYGRSFAFAGRSATAAIAVPYAWGPIDGNVAETYRKIWRSGLGDPRLRLAVNLLGGPALSPREFAVRKPTTTLGASLVVVVPTGQYSNEKLINIGSNRWAFKPEVGLHHPIGRWSLEAAVGAWLFADNNAAYPGEVERSQDPLASFQAHVGYTVRPGLWVAAAATYYTGGQTHADGGPGSARQANSRAGVTASVPVAKGHTVKVSVSTGVSTRVGTRFDSYGIAYQFLWFD
ncbi:MAG TPA: transporter [Thermoanaerobaculia bacterium]|nr:transporter [Thermoanaerobaculia bacterium]